MSNEFAWATYLTTFALAGAYSLGAPGLVYLIRKAVVGRAIWLTPAVGMLAWWCLFLGGIGQRSAFNILELFVVAVVFVFVVYVVTLAVAVMGAGRHVGMTILIATMVAITAIRAFMPKVTEMGFSATTLSVEDEPGEYRWVISSPRLNGMLPNHASTKVPL